MPGVSLHSVTRARGQQLTWMVLAAWRHPGERRERQGAGAAVLVEEQNNIAEGHRK